LIPAETVQSAKVGHRVERGEGGFLKIDKFEGFNVKFAKGLWLATLVRRELGFERWWVGEDPWGEVNFCVGAKEDYAFVDYQ
jgi:hypothetical protein